jgi:hypothetical protein
MDCCLIGSHGGLFLQGRCATIEATNIAQAEGVALVKAIGLDRCGAETTAAPFPAVILLAVAAVAPGVLAVRVVLVIHEALERGEAKESHPKERRHECCPMMSRNNMVKQTSNDRENAKHNIQMREGGPHGQKE